jgi:hypothetical protein
VRLRVAVERMESRHAESFVQLPDVPAAAAQLVTLGETLLAELRDATMWDAPAPAPDEPDDAEPEAVAA